MNPERRDVSKIFSANRAFDEILKCSRKILDSLTQGKRVTMPMVRLLISGETADTLTK